MGNIKISSINSYGNNFNSNYSNVNEIGKQKPQVKKSSQPSWGSIYWQYLEQSDKIGSSTTGAVSVSKHLLLETLSDQGSSLVALKENQTLKPGDKIMVRLEIHSEKGLDYVHLKDLRAANMEPALMQSGYKWQDGLGYYESNSDLARNFSSVI